jgi:hypothetical protein
MTFSLVVNHAPWAKDREKKAEELLDASGADNVMFHCTDYRDGGPNPKGQPVDFTLNQWRWSARQQVDHHVFMTDDLKLALHFWEILAAMVESAPSRILGLLSNHPYAPTLAEKGVRWYRTNSWVVGPCYVVPHEHMTRLLPWAEARGSAGSVDKLGWSDDSELNEWITRKGPGEAFHPIPTPIEHMRTLSTWEHTGHGDDYSHERVSWRKFIYWSSDYPSAPDLETVMTSPSFWRGVEAAPMLRLP